MTSYVLAGEEAGSKLEKAKQLGIPVIDEGELERMAEEAGKGDHQPSGPEGEAPASRSARGIGTPRKSDAPASPVPDERGGASPSQILSSGTDSHSRASP